jgi:hypothetical protein
MILLSHAAVFLSHQQRFGTTPTACTRFAVLSRIEISHVLLEHFYDSQRNGTAAAIAARSTRGTGMKRHPMQLAGGSSDTTVQLWAAGHTAILRLQQRIADGTLMRVIRSD